MATLKKTVYVFSVVSSDARHIGTFADADVARNAIRRDSECCEFLSIVSDDNTYQMVSFPTYAIYRTPILG